MLVQFAFSATAALAQCENDLAVAVTDYGRNILVLIGVKFVLHSVLS